MNNNTPHKPRKNRHAKRHAAEQTEPFVFDELETRSQEFRNDRRLRGAQQANADWVAEPLDEWLSCLDAGNTDLGRETMAAFAGGILCNALVCIAVLLAMASKSIIGKIAGIWFPIMAFVLSGFEHSVANMYYIPAGIFASMNPAYAAAAQEAGVNMANLNALGFLGNIVPVTLGNIVGGAVIALVMWFCFARDKKQA